MNDLKPSALHDEHYAPDEDEPSLPSSTPIVLTDEQRQLDRSLNRKLDLILLPLLAFNFLLCGIDKTNIGNAATNGMALKAGLGPDDIPDSVSLLSVTFVTLQPLSVALGRRVGFKIYLPLLMFLWGTVTMAHAAVWNRGTLIALRLLLGAFEAGYVPTCFWTLSTFYPKYQLALRIGIFAACYAGAGAFSGLIAYGCFQLPEDRLYGYQWLFILEGAVTLCSAICTFFILPKNMETAWFLNAGERARSVERMTAEATLYSHGPVANSAAAHGKAASTTWRDVKDALDWRKVLIVVGNICATLPVSAFGVFAPLVVKGMGYTALEANLMSVPPFIVGAFGIVAFVYSSDRFRERSLHSCAGMLIAIVGLAVMAGSQNNKLRYGFLHVCLAGAFAAGPLIASWLANNTPEAGVRPLVIGMNGYSNIAGVIAGQLFKSKYSPKYETPLIITMALLAFGILVFLSIRLLYARINRQRQALISAMSEEDIEAERLNEERRGDQKRTFIYGL
ncbi:major facilitator superfamily domain-containing protein [Leucosporidium creatinivorum]|uniref:Major facilitator superfamily domain-containing protein n=1 Tax=Leucosporidium creatinivorum TaxID=106004 RepID=A0A1Y2G1G1_9BASI|nr:major facilitator superfamily domain-containing protein [Leucosporidium creatinivorum]